MESGHSSNVTVEPSTLETPCASPSKVRGNKIRDTLRFLNEELDKKDQELASNKASHVVLMGNYASLMESHTELKSTCEFLKNSNLQLKNKEDELLNENEVVKKRNEVLEHEVEDLKQQIDILKQSKAIPVPPENNNVIEKAIEVLSTNLPNVNNQLEKTPGPSSREAQSSSSANYSKSFSTKRPFIYKGDPRSISMKYKTKDEYIWVNKGIAKAQRKSNLACCICGIKGIRSRNGSLFKKYSKLINLDPHYQKKHATNPTYLCNGCIYNAGTKQNLESHQNSCKLYIAQAQANAVDDSDIVAKDADNNAENEELEQDNADIFAETNEVTVLEAVSDDEADITIIGNETL